MNRQYNFSVIFGGTMSDRTAVKEIIKHELNNLIDKISDDFKKNYKRKSHNWILNGFDETLVANMVFVSSFESKYGNMFETIAKNIAKLKYGEENVPSVFQGAGVSDKEFKEFKASYTGNQQVIISKIDLSACQDTIAGIVQFNKAQGKGKSRIPCSLDSNRLKEIHKNNFSKTRLNQQPIDLGIYDPNEDIYRIFEIKAGGDLDSRKAPGDVAKMLTEYTALGKDNSEIYFATLYHKDGEGNIWTGIVKRYLSEDLILIGSKFWEFVLKDTSFNEFKSIYNEAFKELEISSKINELIKSI